MKILFSLIAFTTSIAFSNICNAQTNERVINGKVISFEESFGLEGVAVEIKGRPYFTGTQADGTFSMTVLPQDKLLVVSLPDYETIEIKITNEKNYDIILKRKGNDFKMLQPAKQVNN